MVKYKLSSVLNDFVNKEVDIDPLSNYSNVVGIFMNLFSAIV